jgi:hypothetical protein
MERRKKFEMLLRSAAKCHFLAAPTPSSRPKRGGGMGCFRKKIRKFLELEFESRNFSKLRSLSPMGTDSDCIAAEARRSDVMQNKKRRRRSAALIWCRLAAC